MRAWPWPLALAALTAFGLGVALCGEGAWDVLGGMALVLVLTVSLRHALRR